MKQLFFIALMLVLNFAASAQEVEDTGWKKLYRGSAPQVNDVVHTKADVKFDYAQTSLLCNRFAEARCEGNGNQKRVARQRIIKHTIEI